MQLRYDEDLLEAAVFLCAGGRRRGVPALQVARFHRAREKLYTILDPDKRNDAFFQLHLEWFREWGLERPLTDVLREFPLVREQLMLLAVRKTAGKNDEGAELYVNDAGQRTGLLALRLERFMDEAALRHYLRHELTHLHDMLDPSFGYSPTLELAGLNSAQRRIAHEHYRLLWDITIDGRLCAAGGRPVRTREQHLAAFALGFPYWPEPRQTTAFGVLWNGTSPRHADLLALIDDPRGLRDSRRPAPGASCPLCDFPTFEWADPLGIPIDVMQRIQTEFAAWLPDHGLCSRCLETFRAAMRCNDLGVPRNPTAQNTHLLAEPSPA